MFFNKKISSDVLLLVLLIVQLRLDSEIGRNNRWNREPESREVFLGSSSAYTQITFHAPYSSGRYPHPKSLEVNELDEVSILFNRLNYFDSVRERRSNLIAYYAHSPDVQNAGPSVETGNPESSGSDVTSGEASLPTGTDGTLDTNSITCEREASDSPGTQDLSPEDMDLIEILWKQDIDLGVSRDAYDSRSSLEVEKLKDIEYSKETLQDYFPHANVKDCEENVTIPDALASLNYTIDSETGEYVFDEFAGLSETEIPAETILENETLGALTEDSYLPFDSAQFTNLTEVFSPSEFQQLLPDDLSADSDYFLSQIEDLEKELERFESINDEQENQTAGDMFPNVEDCWPDSTPMLPLLTLSSNHQGTLTPVSPRTNHVYQNFPSSNIIPISNSLQTRSNEGFTGVLSESLEVTSADETFQTIPSVIGPSSVGCAVAESMATLTNDTDPVPTNSIINTPYSSELPILYSNQTVANPRNELLNTDLIWDDLQLVALSPDVNQSVPSESYIDSSSDSASLTPGRVPSLSDYQDSCSESSLHGEKEEYTRSHSYSSPSQAVNVFNHQQNFGQFPTSVPPKRQKHVENDSGSRNYGEVPIEPNIDHQYFSLKNGFSDLSGNSPSAVSIGSASDCRKFDFTIPRTSGASCSNFLSHNHSYHLPFVSDNSRYKPVVRDKSKLSADEEACNKDEKRAQELKLPISIDDIINLAIDEYNERLSKYELTEAQLTLIRDIRRRGKNKVAAQNCRKRKMDQISNLQQDLGMLQSERAELKSKQERLLRQKGEIEHMYSELHWIVWQHSNLRAPTSSHSLPIVGNNEVTIPSSSDMLLSDDDSDLSRGARTKRKMKK